MVLNFYETCLANQTLDIKDKTEYLHQLEELKNNTKERLEEEPELKELVDALESLYDKVWCLNAEDFKQLYTDRNNNRIFTFPAYYL